MAPSHPPKQFIHRRTLIPRMLHQRLLRTPSIEPHLAHPRNALFLLSIHFRRSVHLRPKFGGLVKFGFVSHVHFCDLGILGIGGFGGAEEGLEREEGGFYGLCWGPLVFEYVQANSPGLRTHIRMPNLGIKLHLGRLEGIPPRYQHVHFIPPPLVGRPARTVDRPGQVTPSGLGGDALVVRGECGGDVGGFVAFQDFGYFFVYSDFGGGHFERFECA
mmetsp:Transcript_854/g.1678  ORF Transcript_854/g.1678 Transcript_854/m.1678 type:complete len:217 (+) Transcript_854:332-982(+)